MRRAATDGREPARSGELTGRRSRPRRPGPAVALAAVLTLGAPSAPAGAEDPVFVGWTAALPALVGQYEPSSAQECTAGRITCVEKTVRQMERRLAPLAAECSHSAVFALAYLRTTEAYLRTARTPGFYRDPAFVNHEDAAFAAMYFEAFDSWAAGRADEVPAAWRVAFRAADERRVSGIGDLLLGMNAHVNRDLPFLLAALGLVAPDGSSRKPDHDKIDVMLNQVVEPLMAEEAARFDPGMDSARTPYGLGYTALLQVLVTWREAAWRQAEQLVAAPDDAARARVAASIESAAAANAHAIVAATRYLPPLTSSGARDRYCAGGGADGV